MRTWQLGAVSVILVGAWFIDRTLFGILAGVAGLTALIVMVQGRQQREEGPLAVLRAALLAVLGLPDGEGRGPYRVRTPLGERRCELLLLPGRVGGRVPALRVRDTLSAAAPLCLAARRRNALVELPELAANAAIFESPLECEILPVASPEDGALADYDLAASSPRAFDWLAGNPPVSEALATVLADQHLRAESWEIDGFSLRVLLVPVDVGSLDLRAGLEALTALSGALSQALGGGASSGKEAL